MQRIEAKLIGTALLAGQAERERLFSKIEPEQFESKTASEMFKRLKAVFERFPEADIEMLLAALERAEQEEILLELQSLPSAVIAAQQLPATLDAFLAAHETREIRKWADSAVLGNPTRYDLDELSERIKKFSPEKRIDNAERYLAEYDKTADFLPTGFSELDKLLDGGFLRGTLATIGARPSTGKTTFALNIAVRTALSDPGAKVIFISIEMNSRMIYDRIISNRAALEYGLCVRHRVNFETAKAVVESLPNLIIVDDVSEIGEIENLIYSEKPDLVFIDFVQIITSNKRFVDNRQRIDHISQRLKAAVKRTGSTVVSLSQITRSGKDSPSMSDLKESGGLEQDSDYVIILYREYVNNKNPDVNPEETTVILDKNKFGNTREIKMKFIGKYQRFECIDEITRPKTEESDNDLPF